MEAWLKTCLLLCCYGFFKDMRPSEPFLNEYLLGPVHNLTESQVYFEVYPVWTYSYLSVLVVVFLVTDYLRYKVVIVFEAVAYIATYCLLLWARGVPWMQFMEFCYGVVTATEVAYYTYIYAQVSSDHYQQVSSYTRTALLAGRFVAGVLAQVLYSTGVMDAHTLNYITLVSVCIATVFSIFLPPVKHSIYFHRGKASGLVYTVEQPEESYRERCSTPEKKKEEQVEEGGCSGDRLKLITGYIWSDFRDAYSNTYLLQWSVWWAAATCGFFMILNYIQALWESVETNTDTLYNGAVEAACTFMGACAAFSVSWLKVDWTIAGEIVLAVVSLLEAALLVSMGLTDKILVTYINYIIFRTTYEFLITVASYQVARELKSESYGLVFGVNMFMSLLLQTIMTLIVIDWLMIEPGLQFIIYGCYFGLLSFGFFTLGAYKLGRKCALRRHDG